MEICKQFRLDPTIYRFHGRVVCWCASAGHGVRNAVHRQQLIERPWMRTRSPGLNRAPFCIPDAASSAQSDP